MKTDEIKLRKRIKIWISIFIIGLVFSGLTAFPIETQLAFAVDNMAWLPNAIFDWITEVYEAVQLTNSNYPFMSYGTDWLAFAHLVIAVAFIGPYMNPTKNIWVIQFGMIASIMVIPLALIAGSIREIPFFWRLIDTSFGVFAMIPLYLCYRDIKQLEKIEDL